LPPYLLRVLDRAVLGPLERDASVELEAGLELLLAIDRVLCGGSGSVSARASEALAARVLSHSSGLVVPGDSVRTLQHLRAPFEQPFLDVALHFVVRGSADSLVLELELEGRPRAMDWLCAAGLGYVKAAISFSGNGSSRLRFETDTLGNVARVVCRQPESTALSLRAPRDQLLRAVGPRRRSSPPTNAVAQVEQILSRANHPGGARGGDAPRSSSRVPSTATSLPGSEPRRSVSGVRPAQRDTPVRARKSAL
jgi:hypothetical protein